ncbi:hypothetical protein CROQUDRAFT_58187 [Cronartium quercuum f. sp. fusiforme G11]|uniref:Pre-mRNA-splicing factor CWC2 n=1 Tax=Cronartium quercuum f. sp. fusiforme G11 TaxID=708437 RepID=A0A9P6NUK5_9BASI|nr:hypothetical protein CROQUDRAFT_58187 [Cronartium quercuum f. sp. fusiforme G11]
MTETNSTPTLPPTNTAPIRKKVRRRPARKQVTAEEAAAVKKQPEQSGQTYNIWYNKWAGGDKYDSYNQKEKSKTRCKISLDAGYTRADESNNSYCCLYFARGCCPLGRECSFLHRLPPPQSQLPDASLDAFGREKHSDYRDDMGGVGSFSRQNRTLYIGRIKEVKNIEELVEKHFQEWGEIDRIRVLHGRGVAFVTYVSELSAQFAKEAMMCQSMIDDEVLNVRWATEDPNPSAKRGEHSRLIKIGEEAILNRMNPELVSAVEALDELESLSNQPDRPQELESERELKRARIEPFPDPPTTILNSNPSNNLSTLTKSNSLLSVETLEGLKTLSKNLIPKNIQTQKGLSGLADYDSDNDSD